MPRAGRKFFVVNGRVYFTHEEAIIAACPLGQSVDPTILDLGPIVMHMTRAVQALPIRTKDQIGRIIRDRLIMDGKDIIAGTRIPTATIDWFHRHGYSLAEIQQEFPRLTQADLTAAIAHESTKREQKAEKKRRCRLIAGRDARRAHRVFHLRASAGPGPGAKLDRAWPCHKGGPGRFQGPLDHRYRRGSGGSYRHGRQVVPERAIQAATRATRTIYTSRRCASTW